MAIAMQPAMHAGLDRELVAGGAVVASADISRALFSAFQVLYQDSSAADAPRQESSSQGCASDHTDSSEMQQRRQTGALWLRRVMERSVRRRLAHVLTDFAERCVKLPMPSPRGQPLPSTSSWQALPSAQGRLCTALPRTASAPALSDAESLATRARRLADLVSGTPNSPTSFCVDGGAIPNEAGTALFHGTQGIKDVPDIAGAAAARFCKETSFIDRRPPLSDVAPRRSLPRRASENLLARSQGHTRRGASLGSCQGTRQGTSGEGPQRNHPRAESARTRKAPDLAEHNRPRSGEPRSAHGPCRTAPPGAEHTRPRPGEPYSAHGPSRTAPPDGFSVPLWRVPSWAD